MKRNSGGFPYTVWRKMKPSTLIFNKIETKERGVFFGFFYAYFRLG